MHSLVDVHEDVGELPVEDVEGHDDDWVRRGVGRQHAREVRRHDRQHALRRTAITTCLLQLISQQ